MRLASCANAFAVADRAVVSYRPAGATGRGTSIEAVACLAATSVAVTCDAVALNVGPLRIAIVDPESTRSSRACNPCLEKVCFKFRVRNRIEAVAAAVQQGPIDPG